MKYIYVWTTKTFLMKKKLPTSKLRSKAILFLFHPIKERKLPTSFPCFYNFSSPSTLRKVELYGGHGFIPGH